MWIFNQLILVLLHEVVKLLCMVCLSPLCTLVLFFAFKYVVHCVLFLPEEVSRCTGRNVFTSFSFKKYVTPFVIFVEV